MLRNWLRAALFVCAAALFASVARADDETLANFKKYFRQYKDVPSRVEAVLTLEGLDLPAAVELLLPILKDPEPDLQRAAVRVLAGYKSAGSVALLVDALAKEKTEAVRVGLLRTITEGKLVAAAPAVAASLADKAWDVRRRALQALQALGDASQAPAVAPLCDDPEVAVRCEAIQTLATFGSELVVPKAIAGLKDPVWQVRTVSITALGKVRHKDSVEPLVLALKSEEGRLLPEIAEALAALTGNEYGPDAAKWEAWWAEKKTGFTLPSAEGVAFLRSKKDATTGKPSWQYPKSGVADYHGIQTPSKSIVFVIDVSGSMEAEVTEKERFSDGNYPSFQRIDICKTELSRTIDRLEANVNFNIYAFATKVDPWKKKLYPATILNKSAAKDWIKGLQAIGGSSKEDLAMAGLAGSANLDQGKTNTYGALMTAIGVDPTKPETMTRDYKAEVDTIFFLSDGRPTVGEYVDPDDILRELKAANELRKIAIHTIAIGEFQKDFMRRIAEQNAGVFVDLGK